MKKRVGLSRTKNHNDPPVDGSPHAYRAIVAAVDRGTASADDIWNLVEHLALCADREAGDVKRLMETCRKSVDAAKAQHDLARAQFRAMTILSKIMVEADGIVHRDAAFNTVRDELSKMVGREFVEIDWPDTAKWGA